MNEMAADKKLELAKEKIEILENMMEEVTRNLYERESQLVNSIQQLKETRDQLVRAERLSTVGLMSAGIAHTLNNPMMGILNYVQYCIKHTSKEDKKHSILQDAEKELKRCIEIIKDFLTLSQSGVSLKEERFQNESCTISLENALELLSFPLEKDEIIISKHIQENLPKTWVQTLGMEHMFISLISNAIDSLKEVNRKKEIKIEMSKKDKFIQIIISDNGCGISSINLSKIFSPFFTTKPAGKGTGLGLSICQNIISSHGGNISCESKEGIGTKFTILLPIERRK